MFASENRFRDREVTHVALDADFSCGGIGRSGIWLWRSRRSLRRDRQNSVLSIFDPLRGVALERTHPKGVTKEKQMEG